MNAGDNFGYQCRISSNGDRVAVFAPYFDTSTANQGLIRILEWNGASRDQMRSDIVGNGGLEHQLGNTLEISGDGNTLAIGAKGYNGDKCGAIYVYEWNGNTWLQIGDTFIGNHNKNYLLGIAIPYDGSIIATGALNTILCFVKLNQI